MIKSKVIDHFFISTTDFKIPQDILLKNRCQVWRWNEFENQIALFFIDCVWNYSDVS